ncbi:MAG: hypothetical protein WDM77_19110 [Steroidobacteraceae bacterium]
MAYLYLALPIILEVLLVIHVLKTGRNTLWIWLIIFLPMAGGIAYVIVELIPELSRSRDAPGDATQRKTGPGSASAAAAVQGRSAGHPQCGQQPALR